MQMMDDFGQNRIVARHVERVHSGEDIAAEYEPHETGVLKIRFAHNFSDLFRILVGKSLSLKNRTAAPELSIRRMRFITR